MNIFELLNVLHRFLTWLNLSFEHFFKSFELLFQLGNSLF